MSVTLKSADSGEITLSRQRLRVGIRGLVQGVGFRPFVFRLASDLALGGWVQNSPSGALLELEGSREALEHFLECLHEQLPAPAAIYSCEYAFWDPVGYTSFEIRPSEINGRKEALILPDIATCATCLKEIFDHENRRYLYPFTNCTHCGPRFSIMSGLPYDRHQTSMKAFPLCPLCQAEYHSAANRRFHAQPNACPFCGPQLTWWNDEGRPSFTRHVALIKAARMLREGAVVALKGLGGFQLLVDAQNAVAVNLLRQRKHREQKPFAVMFPSLSLLESECRVSPLERLLLKSSAAPIVLLRKKEAGRLAPEISGANPDVGAMLPYTPLHHILLRELNVPLVVTSGNRNDEPICIDEHEARIRLKGIADGYLVHNRGIVRHMDDSVVQILMGRTMMLRRARGYAPLPLDVDFEMPPILAVGGHLKNTVAFGVGKRIFLSQHIGDLETPQAFEAFDRTLKDLPHLYEARPEVVACDQHPDYESSQYAARLHLPLLRVQHHHAHVASVLIEHQLKGPVLGLSWDGTGYGEDASVWGGEFLTATLKSFTRRGSLRSFFLPGGSSAVKDPWRSALGLCYEIFGETVFQQPLWEPWSFLSGQERILERVLSQKINAPPTTSVGRLFDGVAFLLGGPRQNTFEGQAAMFLEHLAVQSSSFEHYPFQCAKDSEGLWRFNWEPALKAIVSDMNAGEEKILMARKFHNTLVEMAVEMSLALSTESPALEEKKVVLSGGCFQNKYLTERMIARLQEEHFEVYWPQRFPPNDGGLALGQIVAAGAAWKGV